MPIEVRWDNPQKDVLRYIVTGVWDWHDYYEALEAGRELLSEVDHPIALLNDLMGTRHVPANFSRHRQAILGVSPQIELIVLMANSIFIEMLYQFMRNITPDSQMPMEHLLVDSEEEAYRRIEAWRVGRLDNVL